MTSFVILSSPILSTVKSKSAFASLKKMISGAAAIWAGEISFGVVREFIVLFEIRASGIDSEKI